MKYGESIFDLAYLIFAIVSGILLLKRMKSRAEGIMGIATLLLGCGDAFHLIPRVLNYFLGMDFTAALGIGKLVTSLTMTIFYVLLYLLWQELFGVGKRAITTMMYVLFAARIILCLFPQNGWLMNESPVLWGVLRNIPFTALGVLIMILYFKKRGEDRTLQHTWLLVLLSFLFYLPVAIFAGLLPVLGMLMLPKTVCYILLIMTFLQYQRKGFTE